MNLHNQIANALASNAVGITGGTATVSTMRGVSAYPQSNLGGSPQTVIGPPRGRMTAGSLERLFIQFPMRVYVGKISTAGRTQQDVNEWVDAFISAYRGTGSYQISMGVPGVSAALIETWDTDKFYNDVQGEAYQAIDFVVAVEVDRPETYS
jgi:hypothetical protein